MYILDNIAPMADIFQEENTSSATVTMRGIQHPSIFKEVATYLCEIAVNEINAGYLVQFAKYKDRASKFKKDFIDEFTAYARREFPYRNPCDESKPQAVLRWWTNIEGSVLAIILPASIDSFVIIHESYTTL